LIHAEADQPAVSFAPGPALTQYLLPGTMAGRRPISSAELTVIAPPQLLPAGGPAARV